MKIWNKGKKTGLVPKTAFKKGQIPWNKGKPNTWSDVSQLAKARLKIPKGFKHTGESKRKMSLRRIGRFGGKNHPNWKGGITDLISQIRKSQKNIKWKKDILKRDNWTCQWCRVKNSKLEIHHIEPLHRLFAIYKIKTMQDASKCNELWDTNNGLTLCKDCHNETKKDERLKWKVPFVNFSKSYMKLREEIFGAIQKILSNGTIILSKEVKEFEKRLAKFCGVNYSIGMANGTDALMLILRALEIKNGDEVIVPNYTFIATYEAVKNNGADLKFVEVNDDLLIDENRIEEAITEKTKAIMPVHIAGKVCNMDKILEIAKKYNLLVIEDACQALGAKGIGLGNAMAFSFYPAKILGAAGDAGAVCTNNKELADKIRLLGTHCNGENFGFNSRLDSIQASILNVKIKRLKSFLKRRQEIAEKYLRELKDLPIKLPNNDKKRVWQDFIIQTEKRDELKDYLVKNGVETLIGKYAVFKPEKLKELRLPCNENLTNEEIQHIIKTINHFFKEV